jgi:hypothetical protein
MDEFLMLFPGAIGNVQYKWESHNAVSQKQKESYIDGHTAEAMHALVQKAMYDPANCGDPTTEFMKAREQARELIDKSGMNEVVKTTELQVGNAECLAFIKKLEASPNFKGWVDENFIKAFIVETNEILKNKQK